MKPTHNEQDCASEVRRMRPRAKGATFSLSNSATNYDKACYANYYTTSTNSHGDENYRTCVFEGYYYKPKIDY